MSVAASEVAPAPAAATRTGTILVVDDEESFRRVLVRQLANAGFSAVEARDGTDAIRVFGEQRDAIKGVILDLVMPNTSGGETLAMLRYYVPDLPVVIISGYSQTDAIQLKNAERGVGFLRKPFTAAELTAELNRVLGERRPAPRHSTPPRPSL